jgi:rubrerythrin
MKEVFTDVDFTRVGFFKSALDEAGIACYIQNENTHTLMSSMPIALFYPKLCVVNDEDESRARELLRALRGDDGRVVEEWRCLNCGESVPGEFGSCWKCEAVREDGIEL